MPTTKRPAKKAAIPTATLTAAELAATMPPAAVPAPKAGMASIAFATEPGSPFEDGYSIKLEKAALADLLAQDSPDETDPRYERLLMLDERERELAKRQAQYASRDGADAVVPSNEAVALRQLGGLVDEQDDQMLLHTKQGYRLFMGRGRDPAGAYAPIIGGKRVASALRNLWTLTATDNPYADWALLRHEQSMKEIADRLAEETKSAMAALEAKRALGLTYTIVVSADPKAVALGFKSPYGYSIAEMCVAFDHYVRVQTTLARKNIRTDAQIQLAIRAITRLMRARMSETARFQRWLMQPELASLSRADFVPGASLEAGRRVTAASNIFGPIPPQVLTASLAPSHSRRRAQLTAQERALLGALVTPPASVSGAEFEERAPTAAEEASLVA